MPKAQAAFVELKHLWRFDISLELKGCVLYRSAFSSFVWMEYARRCSSLGTL